uniref:Ig-like domain-containing protein n=1 Tax=Amphiprion percula TaxID=161767 RepID=A0A3P8SDW8_AMPPE
PSCLPEICLTECLMPKKHLEETGSFVIFKETKPIIVNNNNKKVEFTCSHDDGALSVMLWYQQTQSGKMNLIGLTYYPSKPNYEKEFENRFEITRENVQNGGLVIKSVEASDSAVYFCLHCDSGYEAHFGGGTRLTVLETDLEVTPPTNVKILPPSPNECRNQKDKKRKKTLVCVASGFYPDHVEVLWKSNGKEAKDGVATDSAAKRVDKFYRITSRLRVPAEDYNTASNTFTCIVSFFDGEKKILREASINGTQEKYLRLTQSAKLSYTVVIVKSCFYGVFVGVLVWKLQVGCYCTIHPTYTHLFITSPCHEIFLLKSLQYYSHVHGGSIIIRLDPI